MEIMNKKEYTEGLYAMFIKYLFVDNEWLTEEDKEYVIEESIRKAGLTKNSLFLAIDKGIKAGYSLEFQFELVREMCLAKKENRKVKLTKNMKNKLIKIHLNKNQN